MNSGLECLTALGDLRVRVRVRVRAATMNKLFDHENLRVYRASIEFVAWLEGVLPNVKRSVSARDHIIRASASVPVNIAEASGKFR
jgi:hypothetical protein